MAVKKRSTREREVKNDLLEQLKMQNKTYKYYTDMVENYMFYWRVKEDLEEDISEKGIRYKTVNGNGIEVEKPNESIQNLQKTTIIMLKILAGLNLKEPLMSSTDEDDYL